MHDNIDMQIKIKVSSPRYFQFKRVSVMSKVSETSVEAKSWLPQSKRTSCQKNVDRDLKIKSMQTSKRSAQTRRGRVDIHVTGRSRESAL